jgi:hypothetical protein
MAIQELNNNEIETVSGGAALDLGSLLGGLPLVGGLLGTVSSLLSTVSGVVAGLPVVGPLVSTVLGLVGGIVKI